MPQKPFLPDREDIERLARLYESKSDSYDAKLEKAIANRIVQAKSQFAANLKKIKLNKPEEISMLEARFDLRMDEGLKQLLDDNADWSEQGGIITITQLKAPAESPQIAETVSEAEAEKNAVESQEPKPALTFQELDRQWREQSFRKLGKTNQERYTFLLQNNPTGVSLPVDQINFPPGLGPVKKDRLLGRLWAGGLGKFEAKDHFTLIKWDE